MIKHRFFSKIIISILPIVVLGGGFLFWRKTTQAPTTTFSPPKIIALAPSENNPAPIVETPETKPVEAKLAVIKLPFTTQAPLGEWNDDRQQNGCEEAVSVMAMAWVRGETAITKEQARQEILAIADYEIREFGNDTDTSAEDTAARIFKGYWQYDKVYVSYTVDQTAIINELKKGRLVILPVNGQDLKNPNFKGLGPTTHMLIVKGYDQATDEFITNDPGTRKGEGYRYDAQVLLDAVVNYPTGDHLPQDRSLKAMIAIEK